MNDDMELLTRLHALATRPLGQGGPEALLEDILDAAIEMSDADFGSLQLVEPVTSDLRIVAHRGLPAWWIDFWDHSSEGRGVVGSALEARVRVVVEDVASSPLFAGKPSLDVHLRAGVRAAQWTPLVTRAGMAVGVLSTYYRHPRQLNGRTTMWLDLLARQAADMIDADRAAELRRHSESRFRALMIASWDAAYRMNPDWTKVDHVESSGVVHDSRQEGEAWPADGIDAELQEAVGLAIRTKSILDVEHRVPTADGTMRWMHSRAVPLLGPDGEILEWIGASREVTEARRAQAELFDERQRLRALLDSLPVGVSFTTTADCAHVTGNTALLAQFCVRPEDNVSASAAEADAPGRQIVYLRDGEVIGADQLPLQQAAREGRVIEPTEIEVRLPNGKKFFMEASGAPIRNADGELIGALAVTADITERKRAAEAREEARVAQAMATELVHRVAQRTAELRHLAAELNATESRERQQISRDLHDDLGQLLSAARIRLANLCRDRRADVRKAALAIAELVEMADRSTRSLATQLAPAALFELGLAAALERLAEEVEQRYGLRVDVERHPTEPALSIEARSIAYRAVRELLINVSRHAGVGHATVSVREEGRQAVVCVSDDGDGFRPDDDPTASRKGMGLRTLRERLSYIGGTFEISSQPGYGTQAVVRIPLAGDVPPPDVPTA